MILADLGSSFHLGHARSRAANGHGHNRRAGLNRQPGHARAHLAHRRLFRTLAFGKDAQGFATREHVPRLKVSRFAATFANVNGERAHRFDDLAEQRNLEERVPGHKPDHTFDRKTHQQRIEIRRMIARDDHSAAFRHVFGAVIFDGEERAEQRMRNELDDREKHRFRFRQFIAT